MKVIKAVSVFTKYAGVMCMMFLSGCNSDHNPTPDVKFSEIQGSGDINSKLVAFRALLGDPLNTTPGQPPVGRREINWDAVPDNLTSTDNFPADFFNSTDPAAPAGRKRGAIFATTGTGLRVSNNDFSDVVQGYGDQFKAFSPARTFAAVGSNQVDVTFKVPGTATGAFVKGFGVIFSDVDKDNSTTLEFFEGDKSLGTFKAPVRTDANGFSFLGVVFPDSKISKVTIKSGSAALSNNYGNNDLVIMDDFLYSEPTSL